MTFRLVQTAEMEQEGALMVQTERGSNFTKLALATPHHTGEGPAGFQLLFDEADYNRSLVSLQDVFSGRLYFKNPSSTASLTFLPAGYRSTSSWSIIRPDGFKETGGISGTVATDTSSIISLSGFQTVLNVEITKISTATSGTANHSHAVSGVSNAGFSIINDGSAATFFWKVLGF